MRRLALDFAASRVALAAAALLALLALAALLALSGLATAGVVAIPALGDAHEAIANAMLAMVGVHLLGVVAGSVLHRENLVGSMISGRKAVAPEHGIAHAWRGVAAIMLVSVLGFWSFQLSGVSRPANALTALVEGVTHHDHDRDEDDD